MTAWLLWMLVARLSDGAVTRCPVQPMTMASERKVPVSCPSLRANTEQFKYLLFLNDQHVTQLQLKRETDSEGSLFSGQFEVTANKNGVYVCKMEAIYPPPFREDCHSTEVKVDENQHVLAINSTTPPTNQPCPERSPFTLEVVMYAACGVLLVYSLTVSCIAIIIWRKMKKNKEDTSVYMNTRPGDPRKIYKA